MEVLNELGLYFECKHSLSSYKVSVCVLGGGVHIYGKKTAYLFVSPALLANGNLIFGKTFHDRLNDGLLFFELLHFQALATARSQLLEGFELFLNKLNVLDPQFILNNIKITNGIDISFNVDDFGIIEASDNLEDGIYCTDMGQEGVSKSSSSGGSSSETRNVVNCQIGRDF